MFFDDKLTLTKITGTKKWRVAKNWYYSWDAVMGEVPKGFETDLASTPRFAWVVFPKSGIYTEASVLHDWLYHEGRWDRKVCDRIFRLALRKCGVGRVRAYLMYKAVRMFGGSSYKG